MRTAVAFGMVLIASACFAQKPWDDPNEIQFRSFEEGMRPNAGTSDGDVKVLRTQDEFTDYLKQWNDEKLKRPKIDFSKEQLVAIQVSGEANRAMGIRLKRLIRKAPGQVDAEVLVDKTQSTVMNILAPTTNLARSAQMDYVIVRTPKFDDKITVRLVGD